MLETIGGVELQQSVDGLRLHARSLRHALGSPACRGGEEDAQASSLPGGDDALRGGGLAGARSTRQHHHLALCRHGDGCLLHLVVLYARLLLDGSHVHLSLALALEEIATGLGSVQFQEFLGYADFRVIEGWEIDALVLHLEVVG